MHTDKISSTGVFYIALCLSLNLLLGLDAKADFVVVDSTGMAAQYERSALGEKTSSPLASYPYEVKGMKVVWNINAQPGEKSSGDAKVLAYTRGYREAFYILLNRIIAAADINIQNFTDEQIAKSVLGKRVFWEREARGSYTAMIDVYFDRNIVEALLNSFGIRYSSQQRRKAIFLPAMSLDGMHRVYGPSPIHDAFNRLADDGAIGMTQFQLLKGEINEINLLSYQNAMILPHKKIHSFIDQEKGVGHFLAAFVEERGENIEINIRISDEENDVYRFVEYKKHVLEKSEVFWDRVLLDFLRKVDAFWKGVDLFKKYDLFRSSIMLPSSDIGTRNLLMKKLKSMKQVKRWRSYKVGNGIVKVEVTYDGIPAAFGSTLSKGGIELYSQGNDIYARRLANS